ncbi:hypothetical protein HispidOSU_019806 [Sigmodon hispidus]
MSCPELQLQSGHSKDALPDLASSKNLPEAAFTSAPALQECRNLTAATLLQARITWEPAVVRGLSRAATLGGLGGTRKNTIETALGKPECRPPSRGPGFHFRATGP